MEAQRTVSWRSYSVTLVIMAINIVGYILCTQMGEVVYNIGSMNAEKILVDKQYYRFVTAIFLHADIEHIVSNMIYLIGLGQMVEQMIGHIQFAVLYLLSGFGASVFSILYSVMTGDIYDAVGASGAIFGLIGALFILLVIRDMRRRARRRSYKVGTNPDQTDILDENGRVMPNGYESISVGKMVFVVVYMIYSGTRAARVDNAAHVGGLVCGLLIMAVMNLIKTGGYRR
ncbi:MAG: rhomboid family intramembrane serine protease [Lachnospiraceae bacterium]|nr:rhomboid family intramembrane serine protease [Lachnospiraceae bacterium]MDE7201660.1 rhomboid family intramembrane serine protease [Lachnospiraceae bacterium]